MGGEPSGLQGPAVGRDLSACIWEGEQPKSGFRSALCHVQLVTLNHLTSVPICEMEVAMVPNSEGHFED